MQRTIAPLTRGAAALALCALSLGASACSASTNAWPHAAEPEPEELEELEEPLSLNVDAIDVRHGSLRVEATMLDGSADVSMWLGPSCEAREVGRGIATHAGFAWSLSGEDVARAIECDLVVHARTRNEEGRRVRRVAPLEIAVELVADGEENVRLLRQESEGGATRLTFAAPGRAARLHLGGCVIGADEDEADDESRLPEGMFTATFTVENGDLARSMLHRRHVSVLGEHFLVAVRVGPLTLDVSEPALEVAVDVTGEEG